MDRHESLKQLKKMREQYLHEAQATRINYKRYEALQCAAALDFAIADHVTVDHMGKKGPHHERRTSS